MTAKLHWLETRCNSSKAHEQRADDVQAGKELMCSDSPRLPLPSGAMVAFSDTLDSRQLQHAIEGTACPVTAQWQSCIVPERLTCTDDWSLVLKSSSAGCLALAMNGRSVDESRILRLHVGLSVAVSSSLHKVLSERQGNPLPESSAQ